MKKQFFLILGLFQAILGIAQTQTPSSDYKFAFKAYSNLSYLHDNTGKRSYYFATPTFSLQWNTGKKNWQEISLGGIGGGGGNAPYTFLDANGSSFTENLRTFSTNFSAKYEYNWSFLKNPRKFVPAIGFGAAPFVSIFEAGVSKSYKISNSSFGLRMSVTPRVLYNFSPRFFGELNLPLNIYTPTVSVSSMRNPANNAANNRTVNFGNANTNSFVPRIGVGYRF